MFPQLQLPQVIQSANQVSQVVHNTAQVVKELKEECSFLEKEHKKGLGDNLRLSLKEIPIEPTPILTVNPNKRFVFCITKDINDEDLKILQSYGKVVLYSDLYRNIPIKDIAFDYLILDERETAHRYFFLTQLKPNESQYNVVLHCHMFEVSDLKNDNHYDNVLLKFPLPQPHKVDYDILLLVERLQKPRWYMSLFKCLYKAYFSGTN